MKKPTRVHDPAILRRRAEAQLRKNKSAEAASPLTKADMERLLHELQVHQIELEMQNEELLQARAEAEAVLRQYTDLYDFAQVGYFTLDRAGVIEEANTTGATLLGLARAQLVKRRFGQFVSDDTRPGFEAFLTQVFASGDKEACEVTLPNNGHDPTFVSLEARITENGLACRAVAVDISARKRAEMDLRFLSIHDGLTGLYNRGYFEETLARIERGRQFPVSLVMVDVDQLKVTNDRAGHAAGDALLKRVAQVLIAAFRAEDVIARIGGDEFAIILPNTGGPAVAAALHRLANTLDAHNAAHGGPPVRVSCGAGTAETPQPLSRVLTQADEDMYREKKGGRDAAAHNQLDPDP